MHDILKSTLLALTGLVVITTPAVAAQKSFYVERGNLFRHDEQQSYSGVTLPSGSPNSVVFSMALPGNYKKNSPVIIRYYFVSDGHPCSLAVGADYVQRSRTGFVLSKLGGAASGLTKSTVGPISSPGPQTSFSAVFKLRAPSTGPFAGSQKAGDRLTIALKRDGASDGCGNSLTIEDVKITYTIQ